MKMILCLLMALPAFATEKTWQAKMSELSNAMAEMIPLLYPDPSKDSKGLAEKVEKVYQISKDLDVSRHMKQLKDSDPALPYLATMFKDDIERARLSVQDGNMEYAKAVIRSSTSYCIACHTRTKNGNEFPLMKAFAEPLKGASWIARQEFFTASRQFDTVMTNVMGELQNSANPGVSPLDLERGARMALSIAIRVKKDPDKASFLAQAVAKSAKSTGSMKEAAASWSKDIADWKKDKRKFANEEEMMKAAREMVTSARSGKSPLDSHSEVKLLRATVILHDVLRLYPDTGSTAEILYMLGDSYSALQDLGLWTLQDMYYVACVHKAPHTELAAKCFDQYQRSITLGYSGSSGTHIPTSVKKHLEKLKAEAAPN